MSQEPTPLRSVPTRATRVDMLKRALAARIAGDAAGYAAFFTADCKVRVIGNAVLNPGSGARVGREGVRRMIETLEGRHALSDMIVESIIVDGDLAAVHWHATVFFRGSARAEELQLVDVYRLDGNLIAEMTCFSDTATFAVLAGRV